MKVIKKKTYGWIPPKEEIKRVVLNEEEKRDCGDYSVSEYEYSDCAGGQGFNTYLHGERGLWVAVIHLAVSDLESKQKRLRSRARAFFANRNESVFEWICSLLDIEPNIIRIQLKKKKLI